MIAEWIVDCLAHKDGNVSIIRRFAYVKAIAFSFGLKWFFYDGLPKRRIELGLVAVGWGMRFEVVTAMPLVKSLRVGSIFVGLERPGVVSDCASWVIIHRSWMYGPWPTLWKCMRDVIFEWKHDKNLVG